MRGTRSSQPRRLRYPEREGARPSPGATRKEARLTTDGEETKETGTLAVVGRDLRAPRAAGIAGLLFAVLFIGSLLLLRGQPDAGSTATEIERWYLGHDANRIGIIGLYLVPFSGIAFLWFIAVIRSHVGDREDQFFATVFLGSGLLFVAMLFAAAATASAPLAGAGLHPSVRVRGSRGGGVRDHRLHDRTAHRQHAALARGRRLRDRGRDAAQRLVLQVRRAALPALGSGDQHHDPALLRSTTRNRRARPGVSRRPSNHADEGIDR